MPKNKLTEEEKKIKKKERRKLLKEERDKILMEEFEKKREEERKERLRDDRIRRIQDYFRILIPIDPRISDIPKKYPGVVIKYMLKARFNDKFIELTELIINIFKKIEKIEKINISDRKKLKEEILELLNKTETDDPDLIQKLNKINDDIINYDEKQKLNKLSDNDKQKLNNKNDDIINYDEKQKLNKLSDNDKQKLKEILNKNYIPNQYSEINKLLNEKSNLKTKKINEKIKQDKQYLKKLEKEINKENQILEKRREYMYNLNDEITKQYDKIQNDKEFFINLSNQPLEYIQNYIKQLNKQIRIPQSVKHPLFRSKYLNKEEKQEYKKKLLVLILSNYIYLSQDRQNIILKTFKYNK